MPNTRSAEKALRQSKTRQAQNLSWKGKIKTAVKSVKAAPQADILKEEYNNLQSLLDKATNKHVIHRNKAARLKSRLSKLTAHATEKPTKGKSKSN